MEQILTVRQLAALAGVSRTTVSLALRNHPSLPATTRDRIQRLARRKGYRSDPLISTLMTQLRTSRRKRVVEKLAYLTDWKEPWEWQVHYNDRNYYEGACRRASELGYAVEHFWTREPGLTQARLSKILHTRNIRGIIIAPLIRARGHLSLDWQHFAVGAISHTVRKPDLHRASHFHHSGMVLALRSLKHRGYTRIGLANLIEMDDRADHGWLSTYLHRHYYTPPKQQIPPLMLTEWSYEPFKAWVQAHSPEVVISNNEEPFWFLQKAGYRIPDDIGYASLDAQQGTPFSGIDQLPREVGACAVDLVAKQLQNNDFGLPRRAQTVYLDGVWKEGATTRRLGMANPAPTHQTASSSAGK